jgi:hypothetical protein
MAEKKAIPLCKCESSQISGFGYDAESKTLAVNFKHGGLYHYSAVPADVFAKMQSAESAGSFLHKHIKGTFNFTKQKES